MTWKKVSQQFPPINECIWIHTHEMIHRPSYKILYDPDDPDCSGEISDYPEFDGENHYKVASDEYELGFTEPLFLGYASWRIEENASYWAWEEIMTSRSEYPFVIRINACHHWKKFEKVKRKKVKLKFSKREYENWLKCDQSAFPKVQ